MGFRSPPYPNVKLIANDREDRTEYEPPVQICSQIGIVMLLSQQTLMTVNNIFWTTRKVPEEKLFLAIIQ